MLAVAANPIAVGAQQVTLLDKQSIKTASDFRASIFPRYAMAFAAIFLLQRSVDVVDKKVLQVDMVHSPKIPGHNSYSVSKPFSRRALVAELQPADFPIFLILKKERLVISPLRLDQRSGSVTIHTDDYGCSLLARAQRLKSPAESAASFEKYLVARRKQRTV